ncbi:putative entry exclusion protein TrbK-alt [Polymorphum gilvum]|jgi:conjugative transfer region protein TrbK|uniref:Conjugal transfer protein TrbK n=1 Tax=Polymorphum gilvum (strain LMG 25793 / CGMCC 1.9160 / SL003B-26A1) TaxID=991905 RepID=F2J171_POLGS|nr:putative entry exclusion protein TrbK-alt [Polymorphum gilvum]ADZ68717.1 hypothetical protein SL003B_0281 [Polymorphum gilvum SL003B-26A1]
MDGKMLARLGAVVFVAVAITATAIELTRKEEEPTPKPARAVERSTDPLRNEQRRCQQLGEAAGKDAGCLRVWAETRDRFLGRAQQPVAPAANDER